MSSLPPGSAAPSVHYSDGNLMFFVASLCILPVSDGVVVAAMKYPSGQT